MLLCQTPGQPGLQGVLPQGSPPPNRALKRNALCTQVGTELQLETEVGSPNHHLNTAVYQISKHNSQRQQS